MSNLNSSYGDTNNRWTERFGVDVTVNEDESVTLTRNSDALSEGERPHTVTTINQRINLAQNPYLSIAWTGSAYADVEITCQFVQDGSKSDPFTIRLDELLFWQKQRKDTSGDYTLYPYAKMPGKIGEYTVDLFAYFAQTKMKTDTDNDTNRQNYITAIRGTNNERELDKVRGVNPAGTDYWPNWTSITNDNQNYMIVKSVTHYLGADTSRKNDSCYWHLSSIADEEYAASEGQTVTFEALSLGREVSSRPAELLPKDYTMVKYASSYESVASVSVANGAYFRNTSENESVTFKWYPQKRLNMSELQSLFCTLEVVSNKYNAASGVQMEMALHGQSFSIGNSNQYLAHGWKVDFIGDADTLGMTFDYTTYSDGRNGLNENEVNIYTIVKDITQQSPGSVGSLETEESNINGTDKSNFYPEDSLVEVAWFKLTVPAGMTLHLSQLEFQIANEFSSAAEPDTVYPWVTDAVPDQQPAIGTPATSSAITAISESTVGVSYEWAASPEDAPNVQYKVDLLGLQYTSDGNTTAARIPSGEMQISASSGETGYIDISRASSPFAIGDDKLKYLYYSCELNESDGEYADDAGWGLYLKVKINSIQTPYTLYLDQTGKALCYSSSVMDGGTGVSQDAKNKLVHIGATARTGCIDIQKAATSAIKLSVPITSITFLEARLYSFGQNQTAAYSYLFLGSESLADSATEVYAKNDGDAFSWAAPKSSIESAYYVQKYDVLLDACYRAGIWWTDDGSNYSNFDKNHLNAADGSYTVTVNAASASVVNEYSSPDISHALNIGGTGNNTQLQYFNYSVEADPGMRWCVVFTEQGTHNRFILCTDGTTPYQSTAKVQEYNDVSSTIRNDVYTYTIAGSQTGCIDLSKISGFNWLKFFSVSLFAVSTAGGAGSVTFKDLHFTSQPIEDSNYGKPCVTAGQTYSWAATTVPSVDEKVDLLNIYTGTSGPYTVTGFTEKQNQTVAIDTTATPYLYYSFSTTAKSGVPTGASRATFLIGYDEGWTYYARDFSSCVNGVGTDASSQKMMQYNCFPTTSNSWVNRQKFVQGSETGCIDLRQCFGNKVIDIKSIKFYCNSETNASATFQYLFVGRVGTFNSSNIATQKTTSGGVAWYDGNDVLGAYLTNGTYANNYWGSSCMTTSYNNGSSGTEYRPYLYTLHKESDGNYKTGNATNTFNYALGAAAWHDGSLPSSANNTGNIITMRSQQTVGARDVDFWWSNVIYADWGQRLDFYISSTTTTGGNYRYLYLYGAPGTITNGTGNWCAAIQLTNGTTTKQFILAPNNPTALVEMSSSNWNDNTFRPQDNQYVKNSKWLCIDMVNVLEKALGVDSISTNTWRVNRVRMYRSDRVDGTNSNEIHCAAYLGKKSVDLGSDNPITVNGKGITYASHSSTNEPTFTSSSTAANVSGMTDTVKTVTQSVIDPSNLSVSVTEYKGITTTLEVDLDQTPYLYYSYEFPQGISSTFGLEPKQTETTYPFFYRDGAVAVKTEENELLQSIGRGGTPTADHLLKQSETGCIDVRAWMLTQGVDEDYIQNNKLKLKELWLWTSAQCELTIHYMYFGPSSEKTIDLIPGTPSGFLDSGVHTYCTTFISGQYATFTEMDENGYANYETALKSNENSSAMPKSTWKYGETDAETGYHSLTYAGEEWSSHWIRYGYIDRVGATANSGYDRITSGNNVMSDLLINLNETPYLHFSITQPEDSVTAFLLQTDDNTDNGQTYQEGPQYTKPWLSAYSQQSTAGQLMQIMSDTRGITYYKDTTLDTKCYFKGSVGGVIDLRNWFSKTNSYGDYVPLDCIRFYTNNLNGSTTSATVNHFYLSSSMGSAYTVVFDKNDGTNTTVSQMVLKNANDQFVSDEMAEALKTREGYTFVGWYTDPDWETYFDIENTPITSNMKLYAGWIDNADIVEGDKLDLLSLATTQTISCGAGLTFEKDADTGKITLTNTSATAATATWMVNKAYSISDWKSLFIGFDLDRTAQANVSFRVKGAGTRNYSIEKHFSSQFTRNNAGAMLAAPYDRELSLHKAMWNELCLPVSENENGYVYVASVTVTIDPGATLRMRYLRASASTSEGETIEKTAPNIDQAVDLADKQNALYSKGLQVEYDNTGSVPVYDTTTSFTSVKLQGAASDFLNMTELFPSTINQINLLDENHRYLYYSITQPENSYTTFALFTQIKENEGDGFTYPDKWVSFYDVRANDGNGGLNDKSALNEGVEIPQEAYIKGSQSGVIDLGAWYENYTEAHLIDWRFYTSGMGTDVTFEYFVLGSASSTSLQSFLPQVKYTDAAGEEKTTNLSEVALPAGQTVTVALDQLTASYEASNAATRLLGWSWGTADENAMIYWNPDPQNYKEYDAVSNPGGAWSNTAVAGFANDYAQVSYQLVNETAVICPVFGETRTPTLTVTKTGAGAESGAVTVTGYTSQSGEKYVYDYAGFATLTATENGLDGHGFAGWYEKATGRLLSDSRDLALRITENTAVEARFDGSTPQSIVSELPTGTLTIWLQTADEADASLIGSGQIALHTVSTGQALASPILSCVDTATESIACYWDIEKSQLLKATAPAGYHFEKLRSDGKTSLYGNGNEITFAAVADVKLLCVKDEGTESPQTGLVINDIADEQNGKVTLTARCYMESDAHQIISCGIVAVPQDKRRLTPLVYSNDAVTVTAAAWNSLTGQYQVELPMPADGTRYTVRAYAMVEDTLTHEYTIYYSNVAYTIA